MVAHRMGGLWMDWRCLRKLLGCILKDRRSVRFAIRMFFFGGLLAVLMNIFDRILHVVDRSLPTKPCKTCKNRFHAGCLYKVNGAIKLL